MPNYTPFSSLSHTLSFRNINVPPPAYMYRWYIHIQNGARASLPFSLALSLSPLSSHAFLSRALSRAFLRRAKVTHTHMHIPIHSLAAAYCIRTILCRVPNFESAYGGYKPVLLNLFCPSSPLYIRAFLGV